MIKAIDTLYNGNYFRPRQEARWAVFFDEYGLKYQYEPQGFILGKEYFLINGKDTVCYLPDFYLPELSCYIEIKPPYDIWALSKNFEYDKEKISLFCKENKLIILFGNPSASPWTLLFYNEKENAICGNKVIPFKKNLSWNLFQYQNGLEVFLITPAIDKANKKRFEHHVIPEDGIPEWLK